jgi:glutathione S-transferase
MDLYIDPSATTSRAVLAWCAADNVPITIKPVALLKGEHRQSSFLALNPNGMVPVLVDGDFVLTEATAILTYLAAKTRSALYPTDLISRARVDELLGWFGTNLYKDFGYQYVYPQVIPTHRRATEDANRGTIEWGRAQSKRWLAVLDRHYVGDERNYLVGDRLTIADYYGMSILSLGELVGFSLAGYPNVRRWYRTIGSDPSWAAINTSFLAFVDMVRLSGQTFVELS